MFCLSRWLHAPSTPIYPFAATVAHAIGFSIFIRFPLGKLMQQDNYRLFLVPCVESRDGSWNCGGTIIWEAERCRRREIYNLFVRGRHKSLAGAIHAGRVQTEVSISSYGDKRSMVQRSGSADTVRIELWCKPKSRSCK